MPNFRILLVEDDEFKKDALVLEIQAEANEIELFFVASVQKGIEQLSLGNFDLIVLDMALPSHDIGRPYASPLTLLDGGIELLLELSYSKRNDPVLIVTQYPDVPYENQIIKLQDFRAIMKNELQLNIVDACHFEQNSSEWKSIVKTVVKELYDNHSLN